MPPSVAAELARLALFLTTPPPATSPGRPCTSVAEPWLTSAGFHPPFASGDYCRAGDDSTRIQIPNFSYGTGVAELFPTVIAQAGRPRRFRLRLRWTTSTNCPCSEPRPADAGGLHRRGAGRGHREGPAGHAGHRQHLPQPDAADEGHHHPGRGQRRPRHPGASAPAGSNWSTNSSASSSAPSPIGSTSSREALQIILPMIAGERVTVDGTYYRTRTPSPIPACATIFR